MNYKIFLINLDGASKRFDEIRRQLDFMGVHFERVSAVDGNLLSQDKIDCCYSKELNRQKYFVPLTRGEIGCYLSHISIFKKLLDENLDYAIVLEDDLVFKPGFARIPSVVESIKVKWDYIKLIAPGKKKQINSRIGLGIDSGNGSDFELVTWRKVPIGTAAYVVSRDGAKKFIEKRSVFYRPLDVDLQFPWETGVEIFGLLPHMVDEAALPSQIDHRRGKSHYPLARVVHKLKYLITSVARRKK